MEKGRKAPRFTKRPSASRKCCGLNWLGVAHCVLSRSTEVSRGITGVPCGVEGSQGRLFVLEGGEGVERHLGGSSCLAPIPQANMRPRKSPVHPVRGKG